MNKGAPGSPPQASPPQSSSLPGGALQLPPALRSAPADLSPCPGYVGPWHRFCGSLSIPTVTDQRLHSLTASKSSLLSQPVAPQAGPSPCFSPPPLGTGSGLTPAPPLFPFAHPTKFCMDLWRAAVHGVAKSRARPSGFTFTFQFHALEKEMAPHSSVLAWRIPGTREPGRLLSMGSRRVEHD